MTPSEIAAALGKPRQEGNEWRCLCPAHDDHDPSLSITEKNGKILVKCRAGCDQTLVVNAIRLRGLWPSDPSSAPRRKKGRGDRERGENKQQGEVGILPPEEACNGATPPGCRLADYAEAKKLPIEFLRLPGVGVSEIANYQGAPAVRIPYFAADNTVVAVRFRIALDGDSRFKWRKGSKLCLYGAHWAFRLRADGYAILVEGESDTQTLWLHSFAALGLPGASNWNEERDAPLLAEVPTIYIVIEPDQGGDTVMRWLSRSAIASRARIVRLPNGIKDVSALYLADPAGFREATQRALDAAEPYRAIADRAAKAEAERAREAAGGLILEPDILGRFAGDLKRAGLVGEENNAKILYLALTTRLFSRPVSVVVKGVSSGGKSFTVEIVLRFFPPETYWSRTGMSDRTLAYSDEDFRHRFLVIYETTGMSSDIASYLIRSLLSENLIRYETVESTFEGIKPRVIEKLGPTGLITTTTAARLHPENETRLLSLTVKDTPAQTKAVMLALADDGINQDNPVDFNQWHAHQRWLATGEHRVTVPFARALADLIPPIAVRLRRDFSTLMSLIRAHALVHRESRGRDGQGYIVAALDDYAGVRGLIAELFAEGIEATVKPEVRETVGAVMTLVKGNGVIGKDEMSMTEISKALGLDKSSASRRVYVAVSKGYLANREDRRGQPARIAMGDPMPGELEILPHADQLADRCSVAVLQEGTGTPPPLSPDDAPEVSESEEVMVWTG